MLAMPEKDIINFFGPFARPRKLTQIVFPVYFCYVTSKVVNCKFNLTSFSSFVLWTGDHQFKSSKFSVFYENVSKNLNIIF